MNQIDFRLTQTLEGHRWGVKTVAFSADGQTLASGSQDDKILLWRTGKRGLLEKVQTIEGHTSTVRVVVFSPDGRWLATGSDDRTIRLWKADVKGQYQQALTLKAQPGKVKRFQISRTGSIKTAAFSHDGQFLVSGSDDKTVRVWQFDGDGGFREIQVLEGHSGAVKTVAFSPDGQTIASGSHDKTICIWRGYSPGPSGVFYQTQTLLGHTDSVKSLSFSPDGRRLVSGSYDLAICVWLMNEKGQFRRTQNFRAIKRLPSRPTAVGSCLGITARRSASGRRTTKDGSSRSKRSKGTAVPSERSPSRPTGRGWPRAPTITPSASGML